MVILGTVQRLTIENYRSVQNIEIRFDDVNVITGPNGCGKSNLFNGFRLIRAACEGRLAQAVAAEGGLQSILWAGPKMKRGPVRLKIEIVADPFEYSLEIVIRPESEMSLFPLDPQIKSEVIKMAGRVMIKRDSLLMHVFPLEGPSYRTMNLVDSESVFGQLGDPTEYPYLYRFKQVVSRWAFYHEFRTDAASPLRLPALATYYPQLSEDGSNLAPVLYLIQERADERRFREVMGTAFPGTSFESNGSEISSRVEGIFRKIGAKELSDGTLRFLCLAAVCFNPHPPPLIAFNEPEGSLNPDLFEPLADMLAHISQFSQLWVTTHSEQLNQALTNRLACRPIRLIKRDGETQIATNPPGKGYRLDD